MFHLGCDGSAGLIVYWVLSVIEFSIVPKEKDDCHNDLENDGCEVVLR